MVVERRKKSNNKHMTIDLSNIDWTAVSSIVLLIMVVATFVTLWVNGRQLKEMKRQWKEEHRPNLQISIVVKNEYFLLCVSNVGNELATDVRFRFNEFFKERLFAKQLRDSFVEIEKISYMVPAHTSKYFYLMPTLGSDTVSYNSTQETFSGREIEKWVEEHKDDEISVSCTYASQGASEQYETQYTTILRHCFGFNAVVIDNEVDAILEMNKTLLQIEKLIKKRE